MIRLKDFEPLDNIPAGDRVSFRAKPRTSGAPLLVHLFRGAAAPQGERIASSLFRFPPAERSRILDFGREPGAVFFLTLDLPGDLEFPDWVDSVFHPGRPLPKPPAPVAPVQPPPPVRTEPAAQQSPPAPSDGFTHFYKQAPAPAEPESTTSTSDSFYDFYRQAQPAREPPVPVRRDPPPAPVAQPAPDNPMGWMVRGESGSPKSPPLARQPAARSPAPAAGSPEQRDEFAPLFASDAPPARRPEPERRRPPDTGFHKATARDMAPPRSESVAWAGLKPLLMSMGIILGAALLFLLIWDYVQSS
jgi:hypothetical protein